MEDVPLSTMFSEALQPSGAAALSMPSPPLAPMHAAPASTPTPAPAPASPAVLSPTPATFGAAEAIPKRGTTAWPPAPQPAPPALAPAPAAKQPRKGMPTWAIVVAIAVALAVAYLWVNRNKGNGGTTMSAPQERAALTSQVKPFRERRAAVQNYQAAAPPAALPRPAATSARSVTVTTDEPRAAVASPAKAPEDEPDPLLRPIDLSALKQ